MIRLASSTSKQNLIIVKILLWVVDKKFVNVSCILVSDHSTLILETEMSKTAIVITKQSVRNPRKNVLKILFTSKNSKLNWWDHLWFVKPNSLWDQTRYFFRKQYNLDIFKYGSIFGAYRIGWIWSLYRE